MYVMYVPVGHAGGRHIHLLPALPRPPHEPPGLLDSGRLRLFAGLHGRGRGRGHRRGLGGASSAQWRGADSSEEGGHFLCD